MKQLHLASSLIFALLAFFFASQVHAAEGKMKVFILAGQSNMEGHGQLRSLDWLGKNPEYGYLLKKLKNTDGSWAVRDDVTISWNVKGKGVGPLTVGWGYDSQEIGPELMFGTIMGDRYKEPILLIKTAWGGKSVWCDFRSLSAGEMTWDEQRIFKRDDWRKPGECYAKMVADIKNCLANIKDVVPGYEGQGYEIDGMAWFQGWNDYCEWHLQLDGKSVGMGLIKRYPHNLEAMIRDLRKDLGVPNMLVAIGELGVGGNKIAERAKDPADREANAIMDFRKAQRTVAQDMSLDNVVFVPTADFWDDRLEELRQMGEAYQREKKQKGIKDTNDNFLPTKALNEEYLNRGGHWYAHYNGSAANYSLVGYALAEALIRLQPDQTDAEADAAKKSHNLVYQNMESGGVPPGHDQDAKLAQTPPMGWNSWNAFHSKISEDQIRAVADAMVSTGMRDAGYKYLVLDDAWMAPERDEKGRLVADPDKFPSGMEALGNFIHSKGLKFGIYEDRGRMTCQQLPGSLRHEQIDMATFASWGVDYIKMDSCFAENNGRTSPEDYAMFRKYIQATGRPIVLSISDFGNAAWAWGGKESAQLWRTSNDIYPWMDAIYHCADTSGGANKIHPAFNGLWQFAGPGHWNDPDMLQVGNLRGMDEHTIEIADRAHFSLWCILAAPLMAGNDLRTMSEDTRDVLTAPEVIAVNQDPRGIQGYKVFDDGDHEVYNKPLADGTTAVLLLNKGKEKADITVHWETIGLSGNQPVRDLWARADLGDFNGSFTAHGLGQHEHTMLKIGRPGPPLPVPAPMPLEKYTINHKGETQLSDLYYIWKDGDAPVYDAAFNGDTIRIDGKLSKKGFGCKGRCAFMFKLCGRADRLQATVAIDASYSGKEEGRFRVFNGDKFSNKVLWDSGKMVPGSPAKKVDIELKDVDCLMLDFVGEDVLGNWVDTRVMSSR